MGWTPPTRHSERVSKLENTAPWNLKHLHSTPLHPSQQYVCPPSIHRFFGCQREGLLWCCVLKKPWHGRRGLRFPCYGKNACRTNQEGCFTSTWTFLSQLMKHLHPAIFMPSLIVPLFSIGSMVEVSVSRPSKQTESEKFNKMSPLKNGLMSSGKKTQLMLDLVAFHQAPSNDPSWKTPSHITDRREWTQTSMSCWSKAQSRISSRSPPYCWCTQSCTQVHTPIRDMSTHLSKGRHTTHGSSTNCTSSSKLC